VSETYSEREFTANSIRAMVAAGVGVMVSIGPLVVSTFGILQSAFGKEYGWSRTSFSLVILLCAVTGGLVTPFAGRAVDRLGVRRVMLPGVALFGLAILGVTLVHGQLWQLYLCYVLVGLTAGVQNMVAYNKLASVWFQRHRGLVLSFLSTCYGIAAAIIPQIVRPLIDHHGWQAGYWFLGAVVLLSLLILVPWLRLPRDRIVTSPVTSDPVKQGRDAQTASGISAKEARNKFIFWLLLLVVVLAVGSLIGTVAQLFPMLTDRGVSRQNATTVLFGSAFLWLPDGQSTDAKNGGAIFSLCAGRRDHSAPRGSYERTRPRRGTDGNWPGCGTWLSRLPDQSLLWNPPHGRDLRIGLRRRYDRCRRWASADGPGLRLQWLLSPDAARI
jgi:MFS family permease